MSHHGSPGARLVAFHHTHGIRPPHAPRSTAPEPLHAAATEPLPLPPRRHHSSRTERVLLALLALVFVAQLAHVAALLHLRAELDAFAREIASEVRP